MKSLTDKLFGGLGSKFLMFTGAFVALSSLPKESDGQNGEWARVSVPSSYSVYRDGSNIVFLDQTSCYARTENLNDVKKINGQTYLVYDENGDGLWHDNSFYVDGCSNSGNYSGGGGSSSFWEGLAIGAIKGVVEGLSERQRNQRRESSRGLKREKPKEQNLKDPKDDEISKEEKNALWGDRSKKEGSGEEGIWGEKSDEKKSDLEKETSKDGIWGEEPKSENYETERPAEVSPLGYGAGKKMFKHAKPIFEELPYVGTLLNTIDMAKDMKGEKNFVHNWYRENLNEANELIYGQKTVPKNKWAGFFEGNSMGEKNEIKDCYCGQTTSGLLKIAAHKATGSFEREDVKKAAKGLGSMTIPLYNP